MTKQNKEYRVLIEYSDGTIFPIYTVARTGEEAIEFIEARYEDSTALEVEEVNE